MCEEVVSTYKDREHPGNSSVYHTGKKCIIPGCREPAGTAWSPYYCVIHNIERLDRISASLERLVNG